MLEENPVFGFARNKTIRRDAVTFLVRHGMKRELILNLFQDIFNVKAAGDLKKVPVGDTEEKLSDTTREKKLILFMCKLLIAEPIEHGDPSTEAAMVCAHLLQGHLNVPLKLTWAEGHLRAMHSGEGIPPPGREVREYILGNTCGEVVSRHGTQKSVDNVQALEDVLYEVTEEMFEKAQASDDEDDTEGGNAIPVISDEENPEEDGGSAEKKKTEVEEDDEHVMPKPD